MQGCSDVGVVANELPYFKTMNYTEWAHSFIIHPLNQEHRIRQMVDAYNDNAEVTVDYIEYFKNRILSGQSNKYSHIEKDTTNKPRENSIQENFLFIIKGSNQDT